MIVGKVIGSVVSTRKNDALIGNKFMIVEPLESMLYGKSRIIATDNIGAGIGERVLVTLGSGARLALQNTTTPVDAVVVGIID